MVDPHCFYLNAVPDPGSQANGDPDMVPDPGETLPPNFYMKNILSVGNRS